MPTLKLIPNEKFFNLTYLICIIGFNYSGFSQDQAELSDNIITVADNQSMSESNIVQLATTDTIPDFESKEQKLLLTGIIYQSDGVTPAAGVILYIEQADESGDFDLRKDENNNKFPHHRGMIKTDADGRYTFYTFIPGNDRRYNQLQQLFPTIKENHLNQNITWSHSYLMKIHC